MVITDTDKKLFAAAKKEHKLLNAWELGEKYILPIQMTNPKTGRQRKCLLTVKPCNGETNYNTIGLSKGYVHFEYVDHRINKLVHGFCGLPYFFKHAKQ